MISALLVLVLCAASALAGERRYALVVGNDRGDAEEQPLLFATQDATRVAEVLKTLGGVDPMDVVVLHNPDAELVLQVLDRLNGRLQAELSSGQQGLLYFYYSGHADAESLHLSGSRLGLRALRDAVEAVSVTTRVLVIDACRAGAITRLKGATPIPAFEIDLAEGDSLSEGMAIITAAAPGEDAQESDRLQGGIFTHHFLAGLQGAADISGDHAVSLKEVFSYASARTILTTSQAPVVQHPSYAYDLSGSDDLVLTELVGARRVGQLQLPQEGAYIVFDGRSMGVVAEFEIEGEGLLALPQGRYVIRRRTPSRVFEAAVRIVEQEVSLVSEDLLQPLPYGQTARRGETTERHVALAFTSGGALSGALQEGMSASVGGFLGLRLDSSALTADLRVRYSGAHGTNDYLRIRQSSLALDGTATRLWDIHRFALGAGLRVGGERFHQSFDTSGVAPDRSTYAFHASPIVRAEASLSVRASVGAEVGLSAYALPSDDDVFSLNAVPYAAMDLTVFAF